MCQNPPPVADGGDEGGRHVGAAGGKGAYAAVVGEVVSAAVVGPEGGEPEAFVELPEAELARDDGGLAARVHDVTGL